jgi:hypothetical protein
VDQIEPAGGKELMYLQVELSESATDTLEI